MRTQTRVHARSIESPFSHFFRGLTFGATPSQFHRRHGVSEHMRRSKRHHYGLPRWLMLTIVAGAFVALAFVNFVAH